MYVHGNLDRGSVHPTMECRLASAPPFPPMPLRLWLLLFLLAPALQAAVPLIVPQMAEGGPSTPAAISPDGKRYAWLKRLMSGSTISVMDVDTFQARGSTALKASPIAAEVRWLNSGRLVVQLYDTLIAFDADAKNAVYLVEPGKPEWKEVRGAVRVVAAPPEEPDVLYVEVALIDTRSLYKINALTGKAERLSGESAFNPVIYDQQGRPRVRHRSGDSPQKDYHRAPDAKRGDWEPLDRLARFPEPPRFSVSPETMLSPRSVPLAFASDPAILYFASNVGRDTYGIYALDTRTGARTSFAIEDPTTDLIPPLGSPGWSPLIFDPHRQVVAGVRQRGLSPAVRWIDPELAEVQRELESLAPGQIVYLENWDRARERFHLYLGNAAGRLTGALYFRRTQGLIRLENGSASGTAAAAVSAKPWAFKRPDGTLLTGHLRVPAQSGATPRPAIVVFQAAEWEAASPQGSSLGQYFVQLGYAVIEINHRGVAGFGRAHLMAGRENPEKVATEDLVFAVERLAGEAGLDLTRLAVAGARYGGYLALRAAELEPGRIACTVAIDPEVAPKQKRVLSALDETRNKFIEPRLDHEKDHSAAAQADALRGPVLLVAESIFTKTDPGDIKGLRRALVDRKKNLRYVDLLNEDIVGPRQAKMAAAIKEFLSETLAAPVAAPGPAK